MTSDMTRSITMARARPCCMLSGVMPASRCHGLTNSAGEYHTVPTTMRNSAAIRTIHQLIGICVSVTASPHA
jgi:hypothetical protein